MPKEVPTPCAVDMTYECPPTCPHHLLSDISFKNPPFKLNLSNEEILERVRSAKLNKREQYEQTMEEAIEEFPNCEVMQNRTLNQ